MSLRRKLMMILLLTSVLPMLAVRAVQAISIYRLQDKVASDMRQRLTDEAEADMLRTVGGYARSLKQQTSLGFALLSVQAGEVENRLVGPVPTKQLKVPSAKAFSLYQLKPTGDEWEIVESKRHAVVNDQGVFENLLISYDTQVVLKTGGNRGTTIPGDDVARLSDMTVVYRDIYDRAGDIILWQYTSLSSGWHFSYPAKAQFPKDYAPSQRAWYRQALKRGGPIGTRPYIDASTQQLVITFAQPVKGLNDVPAGVTAIDLRVNRLLDPMALNTDWADQASVMVVASYPAKDDFPGRSPVPITRRPKDESSTPRRELGPNKRDFLRGPKPRAEAAPTPDDDLEALQNPEADTSFPADVYVVADVDQVREGPMRRVQTATIAFDNEKDRAEVTGDLLKSRSGVRRVSIAGEDRMIAYGQIGNDEGRPIFALIVTPTSTILAPAESAITEVEEDLRDSLLTTGGIVLLILLLVGGFAFVLSYRLTRPIVEMAGAARRVAKGDLNTRVDIDRKDELGQLGNAFNDMVPALRDRMKIRESLAVAMQVQQSLLPSRAPSVAGLDIAGHSEYCDETGGDYYDFIQLDQLGPDSLAIAVGDVTGHGIAAALLMATGRALIRSHVNTKGSLGEVFSAVNKQLCDSEFTGRFMTLMYLVIENKCAADGSMPVRYLSAGHDPVIVYRPSDDSFHELSGTDIPLGIDADWAFNERNSTALRPGDVLVVGTDGIWECFDTKGEQFGKDRLNETIRQASDGSAESIAQAISGACKAWRGEREQNDDITMVVVKLVG